MTSSRPSSIRLQKRILEVLPTELSAAERRVAVTLYRLLARGRPVALDELATTTGLGEAEVREVVGGWHGVFTDDAGRVVGFWGLALPEMSHRFEVDGRRLHTWCAWDALFIPAILGKTARVGSRCPVSGETVRLVVAPAGVESLEPPEAVVSFLEIPEDALEEIQTRFCHQVHFFASPEAGRAWLRNNPGAVLLQIHRAFELGRAKNRAQFGESAVP